MDKKLYEVMNEQITKELFSAYLYLAMAADLEEKGLPGMAQWMKVQSREEITHGMKIFDYLNDRGEKVVLKGFEQPQSGYPSVKGIFEETLKHEQKVTASINTVYSTALDVKDHAAVGFMQWFVDEQVEEEKSASDILAKLSYIKENSMGILMLDKELGARVPGQE
ncbi:MAG: ferritin [Candidatus Omnitrophota bacterium]